MDHYLKDKLQACLFSDFTIVDFRGNDIKNIKIPANRKWYSLIYITGGSCILQIDFDEFIALENRVFLIEKYKIWNWYRINKLKGILVQFTETFYNHIYTGNPKIKSDQTLNDDIPPFIKIPASEKNEWESVLGLLLKEYLSARKNSKEIICIILKILILLYRRNSLIDSKGSGSVHKNQLLIEFRKLVNHKYHTFKTPKAYASELNITPNYLNSLCQKFFNKTAGEIIKERIVLEAKRLLMHSRLTISEVSYKLGFNDNSYFVRYFKKATGLTPNKFRNLWKTI